MNDPTFRDAEATENLVRKYVARTLPPQIALPKDNVDLVNAGLLDSMAWVELLIAIEDATGIKDFGNTWPGDRPQSIGGLVAAIQGTGSVQTGDAPPQTGKKNDGTNHTVSIVGWGHTLGSLSVSASTVEHECGLAAGTIRERAGIESVSRVEENENELTLAQKAAEIALQTAKVNCEAVDLLVVASATFLKFPSLSATLHTQLLARDSCAAMDVGGACVGAIYALATAKALLSSSRKNVALVVASEVNSRRLSSAKVPGEFRGLFGDGACAFVLARQDSGEWNGTLQLGDFIWGCDGKSAAALRLGLHENGDLEVQFKGEQLAKAAVLQMGRIVEGLETLAGRPRSMVDYFAIHEPNPRLVQMLSQNAGIPLEKINQVCKISGNLGSATCGVSLCSALSKARANHTGGHRPLIFVAAVGPGLLWGGTYLH
jgi:3-oxoacyl-[acyl-carrier-protein] synthase III